MTLLAIFAISFLINATLFEHGRCKPCDDPRYGLADRDTVSPFHDTPFATGAQHDRP
jgi:hypothetical protein